MDGDPVREGSAADARDGSDGGDDAVTPISLAEMFEQICPAYIAMGMTHYEFWHSNTKAHRAYRLAWEQKKAYRNWEMWWQGGYIYEALLKVAPVMRAAFGKGRVEPGKYSEEPYPLSAKEAEERREAQHRQKMERMFEIFKRESAENLRKRKEDGTPPAPSGPPPLPGEAIAAAGGAKELEAKGD